jgi:hypothetical protein
VILFNYVIQVLVGPDERLSGQDAFGLQFGYGLMRRPTAVECDLLRSLMTFDRFLEEAYGGRFISILTQQEIDCLALFIDRAIEIAPLVLRKMLKAASYSPPRVINVDQNPAYPPAVEQLKEEGTLPSRTQLRRCKYLNNLIEQDHRFIKRRVNPGLGFFSFNTAWRTIRGYESMNMIRKGQIAGIGRGEIQRQVKFVSNLFGISA